MEYIINLSNIFKFDKKNSASTYLSNININNHNLCSIYIIWKWTAIEEETWKEIKLNIYQNENCSFGEETFVEVWD